MLSSKGTDSLPPRRSSSTSTTVGDRLNDGTSTERDRAAARLPRSCDGRELDERPALHQLLVVSEHPRDRRRHRLDAAGAVQEHDHAGGVVHDGPELPDLVRGDLPTPALGQVPQAQHEPVHRRPVEEVGADDLDELPTRREPAPGARSASPPSCPGCSSSDTAATSWSSGWRNSSPSVPARRARVHPEQPFGGVVRPDQPGGGVDHDDGVGKPDSHVEQASRFDHQDSIGCGGLPALALVSPCWAPSGPRPPRPARHGCSRHAGSPGPSTGRGAGPELAGPRSGGGRSAGIAPRIALWMAGGMPGFLPASWPTPCLGRRHRRHPVEPRRCPWTPRSRRTRHRASRPLDG